MRLAEGFYRLGHDELVSLAAYLEQASIKTATAVQGKRALKTATRGVNWLLKKGAAGLGQAGLKVPEWAHQGIPDFDAPSLQEDLERRKRRLAGWSDEQLRDKILRDVSQRSGGEDEDPDVVFVRAAQSAAPAYRIDPKLAPGWLVHRVSQAFYHEALDASRRAYQKMNAQDRGEVDRTLDRALNRLGPEERQELQAALKIDQLTGKTLMAALSGSAGITAVTALVSASGFGAYLATTTIIHAVMTTFLGITVPFSVYAGASSVLAFLTGPLGTLLLLSAAVGLSGGWGARKLNRHVLAYVVALVHSATGEPEPDPEPEPQELELHKQRAAELERLRQEAATAEELLNEAARKEERLERENERLRRKIAELQASQADPRKIEELEAKVRRAEEERDVHRAEIAKFQRHYDELASRRRATRKRRAEELRQRFAVLYKDLYLVDDQVMEWLAEEMDLRRVLRAEKTMRDLALGDFRAVRHNLADMPVREAGFDDDGRLYYVEQQSKLHFLRIGDKKSQSRDIAWLRERWGRGRARSAG